MIGGIAGGAKGFGERLKAELDPGALANIVESAQFRSLKRLVEATPKRWTGHVRRGWLVLPPKTPTVRLVINRNVVMRYLEFGTPQRSPGAYIYPTRKRALFVPLTRRAAAFDRGSARWGDVGVGDVGILERGGEFSYRTRKGRLVEKQIIYGTDYVLARRVRGIRPMGIAAKEQQTVNFELKRDMLVFINRAIQKATNGR